LTSSFRPCMRRSRCMSATTPMPTPTPTPTPTSGFWFASRRCRSMFNPPCAQPTPARWSILRLGESEHHTERTGRPERPPIRSTLARCGDALNGTWARSWFSPFGGCASSAALVDRSHRSGSARTGCLDFDGDGFCLSSPAAAFPGSSVGRTRSVTSHSIMPSDDGRVDPLVGGRAGPPLPRLRCVFARAGGLSRGAASAVRVAEAAGPTLTARRHAPQSRRVVAGDPPRRSTPDRDRAHVAVWR